MCAVRPRIYTRNSCRGGLIVVRLALGFGLWTLDCNIVRQLHDVIEVSLGDVPPDVKQSELARMLTGNLLEALDPIELPLEGPVVIERATPDDLGRAERAGGVAPGKPDVAVCAATDPPKQIVIGNC